MEIGMLMILFLKVN